MITFREKIVRLYHTTKVENVPGILREGLKVSKARSRPWDREIGIDIQDSGLIYTSVNPEKLTKPVIPGKTVLLMIEIPGTDFQGLRKRYGDPEYDFYINTCRGSEELFYRKTLEKFQSHDPLKWRGVTVEDVKKRSTPIEWMSPDNCVCFMEDLKPEWISVYKR